MTVENAFDLIENIKTDSALSARILPIAKKGEKKSQNLIKFGPSITRIPQIDRQTNRERQRERPKDTERDRQTKTDTQTHRH